MKRILFEQATFEHKEIIFTWLAKPHVKAFWDNTQAHKDDIINFMEGRRTPSSYADGKYVYWVAKADDEPFAMLMTIQETHKDDIDELKLAHLSKTGHTYGIDYMIGKTKYVGSGYGAKTLEVFMHHIREFYDKKTDTFLIDPAIDNPRAKHVYIKAGFEYIADFIMKGDSSGAGKEHHLLIRKFSPEVSLEQAFIEHYPLIQDMAHFYAYDLSRQCGYLFDDWSIHSIKPYESFKYKNYIDDASRKAYLIKIYDKLAGFILLNRVTIEKVSNWNMGEFFVIGKYQREGIGKQAAKQVWTLHPGQWEVPIIPENQSALRFWERVISAYTNNNYSKATKFINFDKRQPRRIVFTFATK